MLGVLAAIVLYLATGTAQSQPLRDIQNNAYSFGEELNYNIGYKFINAGTATFKVADKPIYRQGNKSYDIRFKVQSLSSLDWLYRVNDKYRSVVDVKGIYPYEFQQILREGDFKRDFKATFDHGKKKAMTNSDTVLISPFTHDIVSALYYVRTLDLKSKRKGDVIKLENFYGKETYDLQVKVLGRESIEVEAGEFDCVVVEPLVKEGGLFKNEGSIVIWLSDDERKIPVKVGTEIPIGFVGAELTSYNNLSGPLAAKN
ncbi:MAG: DUF3108 domain-containing protein [Candidatus Kapaibacteriales bacterium]